MNRKQRQQRVHKLAFQSVEELTERRATLEERQKIKPDPYRKALIDRISSALVIKQMQDCGTGMNLNLCNPNGTEALFAEAAVKHGWTVTKKGWPDFLCWRNGEVIAVEVKPENHEPTEFQSLVAQKLESVGIKCYVWRPVSGFHRNPLK